MRAPHGYAQIVDPDSPAVWERDTVSCCHCSATIFVKPGTASTTFLVFNRAAWRWEEVPGAMCSCCWKPVCLRCHETGVCLPLERWLASVEGR